LNIYDTKVIICSKCNKAIGEIEFDSLVFTPMCGICISAPKEKDSIIETSCSEISLINIIQVA